MFKIVRTALCKMPLCTAYQQVAYFNGINTMFWEIFLMINFSDSCSIIARRWAAYF